MRRKKLVFYVIWFMAVILIGCGSAKGNEESDKETVESEEKQENEEEKGGKDLVEMPEDEFAQKINVLKEKGKTVAEEIRTQYQLLKGNLGESYDTYQENSAQVDEFYTYINQKSSEMFEESYALYKEYFKLALEKYSEDKEEFKRVVDDIHDEYYDDVLDDYRENVYNQILKEIREDYYNGVLKEAREKIPYEEWSETRSAFYEKWSEERSVVYQNWSDERQRFYTIKSTIASSRYTENKDFDSLMKEAEDTLREYEEEEKRRSEEVDFTLEYQVIENQAYVTGYRGEGNHVTIDREYDGYKVVGIGESAFEGCKELLSVVSFADLVEIGDSAFKDCSALIEISIPSTTKTIQEHAFEGCTALEKVTLWGGTDLGAYAFANCTAIKEMSFDSDTKKISDHAFDGCSALEKVTLWGNDTQIGRDAFANCPSLEEKPEESGESVQLEEQVKETSDAYSEKTGRKDNVKSSNAEQGENGNQSRKEDNAGNGIRPEFQEAMDEYLAFFKEYHKFMEKCSKTDNVLALSEEYNTYMEQYIETMEKLDAIGEEELSSEELELYNKTMSKILKLL